MARDIHVEILYRLAPNGKISGTLEGSERRMARVSALICVLGVVLSAGVGRGISLLRCPFTGRVSISCCCDRETSSTPKALEAQASNCCTVVHLTAPWTSSEISSQPVKLAANVAQALPGAITPARRAYVPSRDLSAIFESPPPWLRAARI
jgi:hypothetical protein